METSSLIKTKPTQFRQVVEPLAVEIEATVHSKPVNTPQDNLLMASFAKIRHYLSKQENDSESVVDYQDPTQLANRVEFKIPEEGVDQPTFLNLLDQYLHYSVKTGNKQFLNQLYSGFNLPGFIGELITALTNTSMYTYEVAPMATLIEQEMISLMNGYTGFENGDGIFLSGGSNANMVALFSARNRTYPDGRFTGYDSGLKLTAFVNEHAHYSFETAANLLGLGAKSVIKVAADKQGRMRPDALDQEIELSKSRGEKPFFIGATCATTLHGAYDPLDKIADVAERHSLWLHADGSFGGSLVLSEDNRYLLKGLDRSDSFAWNPHKLMNIPLICSVLLTRDKKALYHNITDINADYIFHEIDAIEDLGQKSIQCGRRVDATKLWFAWKYFGRDGYRDRIDHTLEMARYAASVVEAHPQLELLVDRQSFTVCFRYRSDSRYEPNDFNLRLREQLRKSGLSIVNYGYLGDQLTLRLAVTNGEIQKEDVDEFFSQLLQAAVDLSMNGDGKEQIE